MHLLFRISLFFILCCALNSAQYEEAPEEETPKQEIKIGIILYYEEFYLERALSRTLQQFNNKDDRNFDLVSQVKYLSPNSGSEHLQSEACDLIDNGVVAIFGPSSKIESDIVALVCNSTGIPHIQFDMAKEETSEYSFNHQMTLNLYPNQLILAKAYADIMQNYGWKKYTILYDADDATAPARLQDLLQLRDVHSEVVRVRKYKRDMDYQIVWKDVKGERRIVLDCVPELLVELLNASVPYELTGQFNHLFLTNLETHSADITDLLNNETFAMNVTAVRLQVHNDAYNFNDTVKAQMYHRDLNSTMPYRTLLPDLINDAVTLLAEALQNLTTMYQLRMPRVRCEFTPYDDRKIWPMGEYIQKMMKSTSGIGSDRFRTTELQFDPEGQRVGFSLEIYEPFEQYEIAVWNTKGVITPLYETKTVVKRTVYRVATRIGEPYFTEIEEMVENNVTGNERFEGFAVDLIQALSEEVGFEYVFVPVADNAYGKYNEETKMWNGIIGEIVNNDAHMGICDLTITQARKKAVDFTVPFMQLGVSILARKQQPEPKGMFAFFEPFAKEVWMYVLISIFVITFAMMLVARIAKVDWENPHPCNQDPDTLENMWNMSNMLWLAIASITTAGCDILPKSSPTRALNAMWWIFAIIFANSYIANLAAFLTNSNMKGSIQSIEDLVAQTKIKFGTIYGGATYTFFADSNETTYRLAFNIMNGIDPSVYTKDNKEGVERVAKNNSNYVFLMETTSLEYNLYRNCDLMKLGEKFSEKHYAIAVPLDAPYRSQLSVGILRLSERGELFNMKNKWWKTEQPCNIEEGEQAETPEMNFEEVRGIFYTLAAGVVIAYIVGIAEFIIHTHHVAAEEQLTFKEAGIKELKFVMQIWKTKKPVSCTPTASCRSSSEKTIKSSRKKSSTNSSETREMQNIKSVIKRSKSKESNGTNALDTKF